MPRRVRENKGNLQLHVIQPNAAGVDVGAEEIYVAVPRDRDPQPVRSFLTFTDDLFAAAAWLKACGIDTVAMESTGVYWIPLFQILEEAGFSVFLVNARHVKNVPGRKSDVSDCQWIQYLHSVGLLKPSFRPEQAVCTVRSILRHRDSLVQMAAAHIQHMQKSLDQMNLQLHHVISDITGSTGLRIIDAILSGEHDPVVLAKMRDPRIKASETTVARALVGDYRPEHLFTLSQSVVAYRFYVKLIANCDAEIETCLAAFDTKLAPNATKLPPPKDPRKPRRNEFQFDLRSQLYRIFGVDLTAVPGLSSITAHVLLAEVGPDLSRFRSASAFASWLGLCPDNRVSGGQILSVKTRHVKNRAAIALRMAAQSLHHSQSCLGFFYRRMRAKLGTPKAITAAAHKLARIVFHLLTTREPYTESIFARQEERHQVHLENRLRKQARRLGFNIVPVTEASE
jgi:transposase